MLVERIAPCTCRYTMRDGRLVRFADCAPHGGQAGDAEDLEYFFDQVLDVEDDLALPVAAGVIDLRTGLLEELV